MQMDSYPVLAFLLLMEQQMGRYLASYLLQEVLQMRMEKVPLSSLDYCCFQGELRMRKGKLQFSYLFHQEFRMKMEKDHSSSLQGELQMKMEKDQLSSLDYYCFQGELRMKMEKDQSSSLQGELQTKMEKVPLSYLFQVNQLSCLSLQEEHQKRKGKDQLSCLSLQEEHQMRKGKDQLSSLDYYCFQEEHQKRKGKDQRVSYLLQKRTEKDQISCQTREEHRRKRERDWRMQKDSYHRLYCLKREKEISRP